MFTVDGKRIARVFPRKTAATPQDDLVFTAMYPPILSLPEIDEVHISVVFTWDIPKAERMAKEWEMVGVPVKIGGPAFNTPGGDFIPGLYLERGRVITSRGCHNRCWFCSVPKREGYQLRELPIKDGYHIMDDNLLACSDKHIRDVFAMLERQEEKPIFTGGLESALLKPWHAAELKRLKTKRMYFAYDKADEYEPLVEAGKILQQAGFTIASHVMCCYVLVGYKGDTFAAAEKRMLKVIDAGFVPYAMLYRDDTGDYDTAWRSFQRTWIQPPIVMSKIKEYVKCTP